MKLTWFSGKQKNSLDPKFRWGDFFIENSIKGISFISFIVIILIFVFIFKEAVPLFFHKHDRTLSSEEMVFETYGDEPSAQSNKEIDERTQRMVADFNEQAGEFRVAELAGKDWQPVSEKPKFGLLPLIAGTLKVTLLALLFSAPLAILAALYTAVFAPKRIKGFIKPVIELLAGFPSVVIGFFALVFLASYLQNLLGYQYRLNAFVGGIALSLAVIPVIYTVAEEAISSVPKIFYEASLALGANKWQTALFVVLPAATPGIFASLVLGFGRAFGETMIVLMATGNAPMLSAGLFDPVRTLSATIGAEMAEVVFGDVHYGVLFLIGSLLFVVTFSLNAFAEFYIRKKLLKRFRGENA